jgi:lysophospholipase L1-like esterase
MVVLKHYFLVAGALPFLPYMALQGWHIRKKIPKLLPPTDIKGTTGQGSQSINLLTIGESTIAGIGVSANRDGITGQLAEYLAKEINLKINWEVFAKSGLTSKGILEKLQKEPIQFSPDLIVIGTGANDAFRLKNPLVFKNNISQIIIFLKNKFPDTPIVFANMPPIQSFPAFPKLVKLFVGKTVKRYGHILNKLVKQFPQVYFDNKNIRELNWRMHGKSPNDFFSDGVHPSKLAYQLWAKRIGEFILGNHILQNN